MRIDFDFQDLRVFLAIAELGSFQRAAEHLDVSPPALTRRIQKLELSLGVVLFDRNTRSLRPTLAAKRFRGRAQAMLDDAAESVLALRDEGARFARQRNAMVTVAVVPSAIPRLLVAAIERFRAQGHAARIRVIDRLANDVAEAVAGGDADFGIGSMTATDTNLVFEPLADDRIVLALPRGHPLAARRRLAWAQVDPAQLVLPMKGTGNRMLIDEALASERQSLRCAYEVRRTSTALALVEAGIGLAALPDSAMPRGADARLASRPLVAPVVTRTISLVRRGAQSLHAPAAAFCRIVEEVSRAPAKARAARRRGRTSARGT